jgi:hypothetical protein
VHAVYLLVQMRWRKRASSCRPKNALLSFSSAAFARAGLTNVRLVSHGIACFFGLCAHNSGLPSCVLACLREIRSWHQLIFASPSAAIRVKGSED